MRDEQIQELTLKLLSRLNPPRALTGQAQAIKDEATFLAKCINKVAPSQGLTEWFGEFEEAVLEAVGLEVAHRQSAPPFQRSWTAQGLPYRWQLSPSTNSQRRQEV